MSDTTDLTTDLLATVAEMGLEEAVDALKEIKPTNDLEALALETVLDMVEDYGPSGVTMAVEMLTTVAEGNALSRDEIRALGLRESSKLIAEMQAAEAESRKAIGDFAAKVGDALGPLLSALVKALLAAV